MLRSTGLRTSAALTALAWSATAGAGFDLTIVSTTESPGMGGDQDMEIHSIVDGPRGRYEFISSDGNDLFAEGGYLLTPDGGSTLYMVNPAEMTYMVFDIEALMGFAGNMMNAMGGAIEMSFENFSSEQLASEPGGDILGYSTTRYEVATSFDMSMSVFGMNRSSTTQSTSEFWCTEELGDALFNPFQQMSSSLRTGIESLDEQIQAQMDFLEGCAVLRSISRSTVEGQRGETVSEMRVTALQEVANVDPAVFEVPAGYAETSFMDQIPEGFEMPEGVEMPAGFPGFGGGGNNDAGEDDDNEGGGFLRGLRDRIGR